MQKQAGFLVLFTKKHCYIVTKIKKSPNSGDEKVLHSALKSIPRVSKGMTKHG